MKVTTRCTASFAITAAVALGLASTSAARAADDYELDPVHSMIVFQVSHLGASNPFGVFHGLMGAIMVDGDNPTSLDISVPVDKLDMGNDRWTSDIKSADWLNAKQFPMVTFKSTSVTPGDAGTLTATGDFTLHGVTKPMTATITKIGTADFHGHRMGFSTMFKVKRSDFGITTMVGPVSDEVTLMVNMEGIKK
jgi:polyisoprenoid-binding protein YceI